MVHFINGVKTIIWACFNVPKPFRQITSAIKKLHWDIALPEMDDSDEVMGFIIGTDEYVNSILNALENSNYTTLKSHKPNEKIKPSNTG